MNKKLPRAEERTDAAESRGDGWAVYGLAEEGDEIFIVVFYVGKARKKHRIPKRFSTKEQRAQYAAAYVETFRAKHPETAQSAPVASASAPTTFAKFAERWTEGRLHLDFPDNVKDVKDDTAHDNASKLRDYINPVIGQLPIDRVTLDDAQRVMNALPTRLSPASRRHVAQIIRRVMALAAFPARVIAANPIPTGFLPHLPKGPARAFLYPDEEARLLACAQPEVPLIFRVLYGFLNREGMRKEEAAQLEWSDAKGADAAGWIDLRRGWVYLEEHKTVSKSGARDWPLDPQVAEALRRWRKLRPDTRFVFENDSGAPLNVDKLPEKLRAHLKVAGIDRSELFETTKKRKHIVAHDMRGIFVTISLARGKSEGWIRRRTGHETSSMIERYRRAAENIAEGDEAALKPLHEAIPELRAGDTNAPHPSAQEQPSSAPTTTTPAAPPAAPESPPASRNNEAPEHCSGPVPAARRHRARVRRNSEKTSVPKEGLEPSRPFGPRILNEPVHRPIVAQIEGAGAGIGDGEGPTGPGPTSLEQPLRRRALALAHAAKALVDGGATDAARPLLAELVALLEAALSVGGAVVVSLDARRRGA